MAQLVQQGKVRYSVRPSDSYPAKRFVTSAATNSDFPLLHSCAMAPTVSQWEYLDHTVLIVKIYGFNSETPQAGLATLADIFRFAFTPRAGIFRIAHDTNLVATTTCSRFPLMALLPALVDEGTVNVRVSRSDAQFSAL